MQHNGSSVVNPKKRSVRPGKRATSKVISIEVARRRKASEQRASSSARKPANDDVSNVGFIRRLLNHIRKLFKA